MKIHLYVCSDKLYNTTHTLQIQLSEVRITCRSCTEKHNLLEAGMQNRVGVNQ